MISIRIYIGNYLPTGTVDIKDESTPLLSRRIRVIVQRKLVRPACSKNAVNFPLGISLQKAHE